MPYDPLTEDAILTAIRSTRGSSFDPASLYSPSSFSPAASEYGLRVDGTPKGEGFLGLLPMEGGDVMTEQSVGVEFNGNETLIPSIVPTLSQEEISYLAGGGDARTNDSIMDKAITHAQDRIARGLSPFAAPPQTLFEPTGSALDDLSFESVETTKFSHSTNVYTDILGKLEGVKDHVDHLGIGTKAYGVVNDPENHPTATERNQRVAQSLGINLDTSTPEETKEVAKKLVQLNEEVLANEVPNWPELTAQSRLFMIDAKYNTNQTFVDLPIALEKYQNNPTKANLKRIGTESRRKAKGVYSKGMDNRVAKIMKARGLINNIDEARDLGLPLASSS